MTKAHFNDHAAEYDQHAEIQAIIADKLISKTPLKHEAPKILELGCGTGYIANQLRNCYPKAHIHLCDISANMLQEAQKKCGDKNFSYELCSFPKQTQKYDLIISSMALQWFDQLPDTLELCKSSLSPSGIMSFALPIEGTLKLLPEVFDDLGFNLMALLIGNKRSSLKSVGTSSALARLKSAPRLKPLINPLNYCVTFIILGPTLAINSILDKFAKF